MLVRLGSLKVSERRICGDCWCKIFY